MKVIEIFSSIEGEGKRAGRLCTFIRLAGCNLRCSYCDTPYAQKYSEGTDMSVEQIKDEVKRLGNRLVTITGGEPLSVNGIDDLCSTLAHDYHLNIETNGSIDPSKAIDIIGYRSFSENFLTVDYKCPSSSVENRMNLSIFRKLRSNDVLKFVVGSEEDLYAAKRVIQLSGTSAQVYFSPVWGKIEMTEIVRFMESHNLQNVVLQAQLHKIIWDPEMRGV